MRYIVPYALQDLQKKMVCIGGPRQVGKTTLAKEILAREFPEGRYFNWDYDEDRQRSEGEGMSCALGIEYIDGGRS